MSDGVPIRRTFIDLEHPLEAAAVFLGQIRPLGGFDDAGLYLVALMRVLLIEQTGQTQALHHLAHAIESLSVQVAQLAIATPVPAPAPAPAQPAPASAEPPPEPAEPEPIQPKPVAPRRKAKR